MFVNFLSACLAGMDHVRVHPRFLHSNATSHKWVLGGNLTMCFLLMMFILSYFRSSCHKFSVSVKDNFVYHHVL